MTTIETITYHGVTVKLVKDSGTLARHGFVYLNDKSMFHLIENENKTINVYRENEPGFRLCEFLLTFERLNVNDCLMLISKKDIDSVLNAGK